MIAALIYLNDRTGKGVTVFIGRYDKFDTYDGSL